MELTVTAASRSRTVTEVEKKPTYANAAYLQQKNNLTLNNGTLNHKIIDELEIESEKAVDSKKHQQGDVIQRNASSDMKLENAIQMEVEDEKGKKKEKKWTLGGFFRRKSKKDAENSSAESEEDNSKGFLTRRKSKRDKRKFKSRNNTNGFDVVIPQHKERARNEEISVEQLWTNDSKPTESGSKTLRYINRHPNLPKINDALHIPKSFQRVSGKIGESENIEGKKGRKKMMARVEALRDMLQDDSSSDEYESHRSSSSLNRLNGDCRKPRRTDKYKSLAKDENPQSSLRVIKSDFEGSRRVPFKCKWIARACSPDSSDHESPNLNLMNHSGTSSPCRSPQVYQKQLPQCMLMSNSYSTSTFPPGIHCQHLRNGSLSLSPTSNNYTKENQSLVNYRNPVYISNRDFEYKSSKSIGIPEYSDRKAPMNHQEFISSCRTARKNNLSYDQNSHRSSCFENESQVNEINQRGDSKTMINYEMITNNNKRTNMYDHNVQMSGVIENKTDYTSPVQTGISPQKLRQIVRKAASGNSFSENPGSFHPDRSRSYQNPPLHRYCSEEITSQVKSPDNKMHSNLSLNIESKFLNSRLDGTSSTLRYYADQNPRSRNPIQITCNSTASEHPYLSDSQMIVKSLQPVTNSKDLGLIEEQKKQKNFLRPLPNQSNLRLKRSRSNSPKLKAETRALPRSPESALNKFKNNVITGSQFEKKSHEEYSMTKETKNPPEPPVRRLSKQEILSRLQKCEMLKKNENEVNRISQNEEKAYSCKLDEALNELETIYNSLSLKDEDLVDRVERLDTSKLQSMPSSVRDKVQNCFTEVDCSKNSEFTIPVRHQRSHSLRSSDVPNKTTDDMAFRRLNQRDRGVQKLPPQTYLRTSPALFSAQTVSPTFRKESPVLEPDITYDDVVFRNIRHANSTLKIPDPQPPFGIPIGVITPASNSDYLHAKPVERFRPTFTSSRTPDVVKDDLAFRNLRKDNKTNACLEPNKIELKKRAVRSLSANLYSTMQKSSPEITSVEPNIVSDFVKNREKTRSLTDLTKGKHALEKRLKELEEEKNAKRAEFFRLSQDAGKKSFVSWKDPVDQNENGVGNQITRLQKSASPICSEDTWKKFKSSVVELSKFPAAIPSSSLQNNLVKDPSFVDDDQLEIIFSTLAKEAESASKDLKKQLDWLEARKAADVVEKSKAAEEFNDRFRVSNKTKRKRNLSLSNTNELKEEVRMTGSLERKRKTKNEFSRSEILGSEAKKLSLTGRLADKSEGGKPTLKSNSVSCLACGEQERSESFELVRDLSEILKDVEAEQSLNSEITQKETNNVFQEVYEYNCKLSPPDDLTGRGESENVNKAKEILQIPNLMSDVETEFEKLHEQVSSTNKTKETDLSQVDDLMADISSVDLSLGDSYSSFPFPKDGGDPPSNSGMLRHTNGTSPHFDKGEEFLPHSNGSYTDLDSANEVFRVETEIQINMFHKSKDPTRTPTSNSSSENGQKCEKIERRAGEQRKDENNTVSSSDCCEEHGKSVVSSAGNLRETVIVRETKASRLRAASRTSASEVRSSSMKISKDVKKIEKDVQSHSISGSFNSDLVNKKDIDKSYARKSHLNRSHTSEGVYDISGSSCARRRRFKNLSLGSSPAKPATDKCIFCRSTVRSVNGTMKDSQTPFDRLSRANPTTKCPFNTYPKSNELKNKGSLKPNPDKSLPENVLSNEFQTIRCFDDSKQVDIATRAEILAASTLKMINRLDEINKKSGRTVTDPFISCSSIKANINDENPDIFKTNPKKVFLSDDVTSEVPANRICLKEKKPRSSKNSPDKKKPEIKPSILKNKPTTASSSSYDAQKLVSILKRKSFSQSCPPPVKFSSSVLQKEADLKKQSILKKRRSLDENEVMRRRCYSPDASYDFKSILKTQRRLSMEELTRRSHSPDPTPQGILKRKSSKEEEIEDEPQGILKRKSLSCLDACQHMKIFDNAADRVIDTSGNVRPILKKKSSSEEHSTSDPTLTEGPKSILKKKGSLEIDEQEEKPMKPILKSSRIPSTDEPEDGKRNKSLIFNTSEEPKPILKRENIRSEKAKNGLIPCAVANRRDRPHSCSDIDDELNVIFLKRRFTEFHPVDSRNFGLELQKTRRASSSERLKDVLFKRPFSVAEKVKNFENLLEVEKVTKEKMNLPSGTLHSNFVESKEIDNQRAVSGCSLGALPKKRSGKNAPGQLPSESSPEPSPKSSDIDSSSDIKCRSNSENSRFHKTSSDSTQDVESHHSLRQIDFHSKDSDDFFLSKPVKQSGEKYDTEHFYTVDSSGKISYKTGSTSAGSFSSKDNLKYCEGNDRMKKPAQDCSEKNNINRRQEKKLLESNARRYHSQPVSAEEVRFAVEKYKANNKVKCFDQDESHKDEMCTMSYEGKLRFFESTFASEFFESLTKKRGIRSRTQPVTSEEVETARRQKPSSFAFEVPWTRNANRNYSGFCSLKENMSHLPSSLSKSKSACDQIKGKSILKSLRPKSDSKLINSESDSSDSGKKKKLKNELNENNRHLKRTLRKVDKEVTSELKSILKQPSSAKEVSSSSKEELTKNEYKTPHKLKSPESNLAAILQRVEPTGGNVEKLFLGEETETLSECMQNVGIAKVIDKSRNNSLMVESRSQSFVSSAFQSILDCSKCPLLPNDVLNMNQKNDKTAANFRNEDATDNPLLRSVGLKRNTTPLRASDEDTDDDLNGASIRERLARLKKSGELDWQKRKSHVTNLEDELSVIAAENYLLNEHNSLRSSSPNSSFLLGKEKEEMKNSSSILADRLGKLDAAQQGWKKRIQPSDAVRFSAEGKMLEKKVSSSSPEQLKASLQIPQVKSYLAGRKKRSPKAVRFKSKLFDSSISSVSSSSERINSLSRPVSGFECRNESLSKLSLSGNLNEVTEPVVSVPKNDDETFTSFFDGLNTKQTVPERLEIKDEDLDAVTKMKSSQLLVQKRNIKIQKRRMTVKNPVKALAARINLQEYREVKTDSAELKRMKVEKAGITPGLAIEALAGLASQEDFTSVSLKKTSESSIRYPDAPYKNLMLLQVKGRRHVQTRLIEPVAHNINTGDCFILVTPSSVFLYVGEFANVIEKSRGAEISSHIQQKGDLGCTTSSVITIGEGGRASAEQVKEFWRLLNGEPGCEQKAGNVDEDELFESALIDTNMVYEVLNDELVPIEVYWGSIPKIEILDPNKILVFDFGSEFYVWNGKNVNSAKRKMALKLAKELWEEGFDYTDCDFCPLTAASYLGNETSWCAMPDSEKAGPIRPDWALFAKITQNMETVLFREKFLDWPDYTRNIREEKKNVNGEHIFLSGMSDLKPCDAKKMLDNVLPEPDLVLEGNHLGRGMKYFNEEKRKCLEVTTHKVSVWHINEYEYSEVPTVSIGQFHMGDSYVVRWHYVIAITGRELGGQPSKHLTTGRSRYAYFFWQGQNSPINDKGASACLTMELDKEHGPQVRVVQGLEPPAFIRLFKGRMVIHMGRRFPEASCKKLRLFICRGTVEPESVLFEVPCSMRQLRSLSSFVLIDKDTGKVIVWHGWKSPESSRKIALNAAKRLQLQTPEFEFKAKEIKIREEIEGSESQDFIIALGGNNRQLYFSLIQDKTELRTPRLFHLTSVSGEFLFSEVISFLLIENSITPLPFLQSDLYSASQPALFLLDSSFGLWLWQGWWEKNSENERGSGYVRFQAERRAAMSTAISYWNLKYGTSTLKAYLIWAGLEPLEFTNQFPFWTDRDDVSEINMKDGRKPGEVIPIKTELASLTQSTYPLAQLLNRPLPDGVDPTSLEDYLEPQSFRELFAMEKQEFLNLPAWKKKKLKQDVGLF